MKRVVKATVFIYLFSVGLIFLLTECGPSSTATEAEKLYVTKCARCHGKDGKKGRKGAKDLTLSTKSFAYRVNQLKEGKGKMPSFSDRMTEEQIKLVADYTIETFSQKKTDAE